MGRTPYRLHSLGDGSKCRRGKGLKTVCIAPIRTSDGNTRTVVTMVLLPAVVTMALLRAVGSMGLLQVVGSMGLLRVV